MSAGSANIITCRGKSIPWRDWSGACRSCRSGITRLIMMLRCSPTTEQWNMPMEPVILVVMYWLILHVPGGHEVSVNAKRITAMREGEGGDKNKLLTGEVRCVISTDDGK